MKKIFAKILMAAMAVVSAATITSCTGEKFHVSGNITQAKDSMLYFENMSLDGPVKLDSVKLSEDGDFSFSAETKGAPEFYRLRIAGQIINIAADSTENITVNAVYPTMATNYTVEGSEECTKIKELALMQINLQNKVLSVANNHNISAEQADTLVDRMIEAYKTNIKLNYIYKAPMKAYSYFALFQAIGNRLIFNPRESRDDIKAFAAVATSWDTYYPNSERGKNLHNIAIEGMKTVRIMESEQRDVEIDPSKVQQTGIIDIALQDNRGVTRRLTDLKGKVVLLYFHVFASEGSMQRIMALCDLYNKYHARGFEIYLVSVDPDEHFWKEQTSALPWINVHDDRGTSSPYLRTYNVQQLPSYFLIDKTNSLRSRDAQIKDLDAAIAALL